MAEPVIFPRVKSVLVKAADLRGAIIIACLHDFAWRRLAINKSRRTAKMIHDLNQVLAAFEISCASMLDPRFENIAKLTVLDNLSSGLMKDR